MKMPPRDNGRPAIYARRVAAWMAALWLLNAGALCVAASSTSLTKHCFTLPASVIVAAAPLAVICHCPKGAMPGGASDSDHGTMPCCAAGKAHGAGAACLCFRGVGDAEEAVVLARAVWLPPTVLAARFAISAPLALPVAFFYESRRNVLPERRVAPPTLPPWFLPA